jgi:hypothetical protein
MPSPNLAIAHVAASQNQKEVTINDAIDALDRAMTDTLALDLSAGSLSLAAAQLRAAMVLHPMGALTGPASLLVPQIRRVFALLNNDAAFAVTVERGASAIAVQPGENAVLICDGTPNGLFRVGPGAPVYDFGMVAGTAPGAGEVLGKVVIPRPLLIPADLAGSAVHVDTAPDDDFAIVMTRNAVAVASITVHVDASATLATSGNAPVTIAAGDVVRFVAPASPDASIAGISLTIAARRLA